MRLPQAIHMVLHQYEVLIGLLEAQAPAWPFYIDKAENILENLALVEMRLRVIHKVAAQLAVFEDEALEAQLFAHPPQAQAVEELHHLWRHAAEAVV